MQVNNYYLLDVPNRLMGRAYNQLMKHCAPLAMFSELNGHCTSLQLSECIFGVGLLHDSPVA